LFACHDEANGMSNQHGLAAATIAVRGGFHPQRGEGTSPPIHLSSTFLLAGDPEPGDLTYGRGGSPAFGPLEEAVAALEGGQHGVVFNAGVAATYAVFDEVPRGGALVMPVDVYYGFRVYADQVLAPRGIEVRYIDQTDLGAVAQAAHGASLLWTETPTNPYLRVVDLAGFGAIAADHGVPWFCDNTFASPALQHPLHHGAAGVMHSVTKYIGGHSDLILGVIVCDDADLAGRLRARRSQVGTQPDGFSCWLARRGMQTMPLRVRQQSANALELATRLNGHPTVKQVFYPGLSNHLGHEVATKQMHGGFGGMLSIVTTNGAEGAQTVIDRCQVWTPATSLGSVESLIERRARWSGEQAHPALLRLSVGIEDVEDLWSDLEQALNGIG
jgi:cystathionine gamma-synthase